MQDFVLRDLDTGETRLITDLTVAEESSDTTVGIIRKQSQERLSKKRSRERAAATKAALQNSSPTKNEIPLPTRTESSAHSKRAYSDEMVSMQSNYSRSATLVKVTAHKKRERDFAYMYRWQELRAHKGPIRVLAFSPDGRKLATAGHDMVIRVWDVDARVEDRMSVPRNHSIANLESAASTATESNGNSNGNSNTPNFLHYQYQREYLRNSKPICELRGHTAEIVDVCWSKNGFLCSGSMDKTIRLWHPSKKSCLRVFWHNDFVTTVRFHPSDEQVCISGSADGSLRLWHLKEAKLLSEAKLDDIITACALTKDGSTVLVGTLHGRVKFYSLFDEIQGEWQFVHTTQLDVRSRRAKKGRGKKVAGIAFRPGGSGGSGDNGGDEEVCISSSDSRLRLYRYDDKALLSKFLGHVNEESQLSASFSPCGNFVLSASENRCVCIWEVNYQRFLKRKPDATNNSPTSSASTAGSASASTGTAAATSASGGIPPVQTTTTSKRKAQNAESDKGKNLSMESFDPHDNGFISAAVFAPKKAAAPGDKRKKSNSSSGNGNGNMTYSRRAFGLVLVTASEEGEIRVFGCI